MAEDLFYETGRRLVPPAGPSIYGAPAGAAPAAAAAAAPAAPTYAEQVVANAAKLKGSYGATGFAPTAEAVGSAVKPRMAVPAWLKTAGGFGARAAGGVLAAAPFMLHSGDAGAGSDYQVGNGVPATPAQRRYANTDMAVPESIAPARGAAPAMGPAPGAWVPQGEDATRQQWRAGERQSIASTGWEPPATLQPRGSVNSISAENFAALDPATSRALSEARQAAAARGDFGAVADSYRANGGTFLGKTAVQAKRETALEDALRGFRKAKTIPEQQNYAHLINSLTTTEAATAQHGAEIGVKQEEIRRKSVHDWAKLALDATTQGAASEENLAKAGVSKTAIALAQAYLKANPGDYIGAGHALHGTSPTAERYSVPLGAMPDKAGAFPVLNAQKGTIANVAPARVAEERHIAASMKERGLTRAQALKRYSDEGFDVSKLKP